MKNFNDMKVLLVGNGGRESALAWKIAQSPKLSHLYISPGNAGTQQFGLNLNYRDSEIEKLLEFAINNQIDLTVLGTELTIDLVIVDLFKENGLKIFGPSQICAQIESSKSFAKQIMQKRNIPTADSKLFTNPKEAYEYVEDFSGPLVVKADGLAAGKGVFVCANKSESKNAINELMEQKTFGSSGESILIEQLLTGWEASAFVFCDGISFSSLIAACDHKRIGEGDTGPNTGGMGAFSPPANWDEQIEQDVLENIVTPMIEEMKINYVPYVGVLFIGLMINEEGPKVIEFNCRLGDPESQVILPLMKSDIIDVMLSCINGDIQKNNVQWSSKSSVGVVMASGGYPKAYDVGFAIKGLDTTDNLVNIFYAGAELDHMGNTITSGGRVLTVNSVADTMSLAIKKCYENLDRIQFEDSYYRKDIGTNI